VSSQAVYMDDFIRPLSAVSPTTVGGSGSVFQATKYLGFTRVNTGSTTGSSARRSGPIPSGANLTGVSGTAELTFRLAGITSLGFDLNATIEAGLMVGTTLVGGFRYTAGATASTWSAVSRGTGETVDVVTTGVAPYTTLFQIFKVRVVGGSPTVEFYVNGTLVASQTLGGIGNLGPNGSAFYVSNSAAESKGVIADYFRWTHTR